MFAKRYKELTEITPGIKHWLSESKYADKRYGVRLNDNFKIITGAFEEDQQLDRVLLPIYSEGTTLVDVRAVVKSGINPMDNIKDSLSQRGTGAHSIETAVTLTLFEERRLDYLRDGLVKALSLVSSYRIGSSLSLDGMDKAILSDLFTLFFIRKLFPDTEDFFLVVKRFITELTIKEDDISKYLKDYGTTMEDLLNFSHTLDVSKRLGSLKEDVVYNLLSTLSYTTLSNFIVASFTSPAYFISVLYTTMKNPFFKKSYLYSVLNQNNKYLELDTTIKNIEHVYKEYI